MRSTLEWTREAGQQAGMDLVAGEAPDSGARAAMDLGARAGLGRGPGSENAVLDSGTGRGARENCVYLEARAGTMCLGPRILAHPIHSE